MTHTVNSRYLLALHVLVTLALSAVAARLLVLGFGVLGELSDLVSNAPIVRFMPSGWTPAFSVAGSHELASYAAFPGCPALLVLGIYLCCLEHAVGMGAVASRRRASTCLPAFGMIWSISAAGLWLWSLQSVRLVGYIPTHAGTTAGLVFVGALVCLAAIIHIQGRESAANLNENAPA